MQSEIIVAGFGGQGVLFAGQLLAHAGLAEGRCVSWIPSYGPEMRGGTANCTVIVSDEEIGSPLVRWPGAAVVLNPPSLARYAPLVKPGGILLLDATLVSERSGRDDIRELALPARAIAGQLGLSRAANMVLIGALAEASGVVRIETLEAVLADFAAAHHPETLAINVAALRLGAELAREPVVMALRADH